VGNRSREVVNIWCDWLEKFIGKKRHGAFFPKLSESPSSETTSPIEKKSRGVCKNGTDSRYLYAKFGGDPPLHDGVRKRSWEFFLCLSCSVS